MNETMRERLFNMRMSEEESARLDAVSRHYGLNAAGLIRMLVKREADAIGFKYEPEPPAKRTERARRDIQAAAQMTKAARVKSPKIP